jgi:hypothetical protein
MVAGRKERIKRFDESVSNLRKGKYRHGSDWHRPVRKWQFSRGQGKPCGVSLSFFKVTVELGLHGGARGRDGIST